MKDKLINDLNQLGIQVFDEKISLKDIRFALGRHLHVHANDSLSQSNKKEIVELLMDQMVHSKNKKSVMYDEDEIEEFKKEIEDTLKFDSGNWSSWGKQASFSFDGDAYGIMESEDAAENIALESVEDQLRNEPELFESSWLRQHLYITDTDKRIISNEDADSYVESMSDEEVLEYADKKEDYDAEEDENKKESILEQAKEDAVEKHSEYVYKRLEKDPVGYFVDEMGIYTEEELAKQPFMSIDVESAAKEAVEIDGWAHFISRYDGNYATLKNGMVVFRED